MLSNMPVYLVGITLLIYLHALFINTLVVEQTLKRDFREGQLVVYWSDYFNGEMHAVVKKIHYNRLTISTMDGDKIVKKSNCYHY